MENEKCENHKSSNETGVAISMIQAKERFYYREHRVCETEERPSALRLSAQYLCDTSTHQSVFICRINVSCKAPPLRNSGRKLQDGVIIETMPLVFASFL